MTDITTVKSTESGTLRVFALDMPPGEAEAMDPKDLQSMLGADPFRADRAEIVSARKLGDMSLAAYLRDAYDIPDTEMSGHADFLSSPDAVVALVPASAFAGESQELQVQPPLAAVGLFREVPAEAHSTITRVPSSEGTDVPPETPAAAPKKPAPIVLAAIALIVILALVFLLL